ncbi:MAG TPA: hypothetical protein VFS88_07520 [Micavibrio sp.]|nr:hypothetical protein [Micavibrio sp.]
MDFRACSCDNTRYSDYERAVERHADRIKIADSFKKAVGLVFRDQHPQAQREPVAIGGDPDTLETKRNCGGCTPHIASLINKKGLRPAAEYESWLEWHHNRASNCGGCSKGGQCGVKFAPS